MSSTQFRRMFAKVLGTSAIAATLLVAACGSSTTTASGPTPTVAATCNVSNADLATGAGGSAVPTVTGLTGKLTISGSTALKPLFDKANTELSAVNSGLTITVNGGGSGQGLTDAGSGASDIGMSDIFQVEKAGTVATLVDHQVAAVAFTMVVNSDISSKVRNLTTDQIKQIYAGTITNWSQVGGPSENITVIYRKAGSGTRANFDRYVLGDPKASDQPAGSGLADGTLDLLNQVGGTPGAIGYAATNYITNPAAAASLYPLCIDGYSASPANINSGKYKFWSYEHAYTASATPSANATAFLNYVTGSDFQAKDLASLVFLKVGDLSAAATATHPTPTA